MKKRFVVELTKTICYEVEAEKFVADIESDKEAEIQCKEIRVEEE